VEYEILIRDDENVLSGCCKKGAKKRCVMNVVCKKIPEMPGTEKAREAAFSRRCRACVGTAEELFAWGEHPELAVS